MAVGRISGPLLKANLERNGIDLAVETDLLYIDVNNGRIGIKTNTPQYDLDVNGIISSSRINTDFLTVNSNYNIGNVNITSTVGNLVLQASTLSDRTVIIGDLEVTGEILDLPGGFNIVNDASSSIFVDNGSDIRFSDGVDTVISLSSDATHEIIEINNTSTLDSVTGRGNTTTNDITVGTITADELILLDNSRIKLGDDGDLQIFHDGTRSFIRNTNGLDLRIENFVDDADISIRNDDGTGGIANYIVADGGTGQVRLYYYGAQKFTTTSTGIEVTGEILVSTIDTTDSSAITVVPAAVFNSDVTVENDLTVTNKITASEFIGDGSQLTGLVATYADLTDTDITGRTANSLTRFDGANYVPTAMSEDASGNLSVAGAITVSGTVDGRDIAADGTKLDGIETGATADQTASEILTAIKTVDGASSGLDADVLDGQEGSYYLDWTNTTNKPDPVITLSGDASGSVTLTDLTSGTLTATLATVNSNVGSFGSATAIPVVTVNAKGLITAVSTASISTDLATAGDSGTGTVALASQSLTIGGTANEIETSASGQSVTIGLPNSVAITTSLTVGGNAVLTTANEGSGNGLDADTVDGIEAAALTQSGDSVALTGDVTGSTTVAADGTISVATTIAANSVDLGTDTTGNYVATVSGTTNEIEVSGSGSETAAVTVGLPSDVTIGNELTVTTALYTPTIDTTDSSTLTIVPAATFNSDVTVENSLTVSNDVNVGSHIDYGLYYTRHAPYQEGRMWYDQEHATINYWSDDPNVVHELGLEEHQRVYNNTGSTILKGQPLYFSGNYTSGSKPAVPTVGLADATDVNKYNAQGIAAGDIANNSYGYCLIAGQLFDVDTSALTAGTNFFVGLTPGAVQNTGPVYPNYPMCLGWVVKSDATSGILLVNQQNHSVPSFRVRTAAHIGDDLIVDGDLIVNGTTTSTSSANIGTGAAFIYLNSGDTIGEANTTFTGSGLDDAYFSGHYRGTTTTTYYVRIDSTGTPDTFEWSKDNFSSTEATGVAITGAAQTLDNGIEIDFGATTGHTSGDVWSGTAAPANVDTGFFSNRNTGGTGVGYTHMGLFWDVTDNKWKIIEEYDPEPTGSVNTAHASYNEATLVADTFEAASGIFSSTLTLGGNSVLTTANEGSGNGLDADTLDGQEGTYYLDGANFTGTLPNDYVTLGTMTTGNYVATVTGTTNEIEVSGSGSETAAVTIGLPNDVTIGNELTVTTALFTPIIDTTDSSALTVTPATTFSSDINVQNNITSDNFVEAAKGFTMGGINSFRFLNGDDSSFAIGPGSLQNWQQTSSGWNNIAIGKNVLTQQRTNGSNIGIGSDSQRNSTGFFNVGIGRSSLWANDSQSNVAIGDFTLSNSTTGAYNTAVGYNTGNDITTGQRNVSVGAFSSGQSTTGNYNVAMGYAALENVTNDLNVVIGYFAGNDLTTGFRNTVIGSYALDTGATSAQENVAIGSSAMGSGVGGTKNVAVGRSAGLNIASDFNTVIGADAGTTITSGSNLTVVGYNAEPSAAGATNEITLGDTNVTKLRVPGAGFELTSGTAVFDTKIEVPVIDTADSSAITITPAAVFKSDVTVENNIQIDNDLIVLGDLTVQGTTTQVDSNVVNIGDNIITLNADEAGTPSQNAGIEVERGTSTNVQLRWNESNDKWEVTEDGATYSNILTTSDEGSGNGLDADTLDGQEGTYYLDGANFTGTLPNNYVTLGTMTTGNYVATITGTTNQVDVTGSGSETAAVTVSLPDTVILGTSDTDHGSLYLYSDGTGSSQGGSIRLYTAADYDTTNDFYTIKAWNDSLTFEKADGTDLFTYNNSDGSFRFPDGLTYIGTMDNTKGALYLTGDGAGSADGGELRIYNAADHDTNVNYYSVYAESEDFLISYGSTDFLQYDYSASKWVMPQSGGLSVTGNITVSGQLEVSTIDTSDSSAITIIPGATFNSDVTVENELKVRNGIENISGNILLPASLGSADQVLTVSSDGTRAEWKAATGGGGGGGGTLRLEEFPVVNNGSADVTLSQTFSLSQLDVYLNGARLKSTTDFTVSGTTLTFSNTLSTGDVVAVYIYDTSTVLSLVTGDWGSLNDVNVTGQATNTLNKFNGTAYVPALTTEDGSGNMTVTGTVTATSIQGDARDDIIEISTALALALGF